MAAVLILGAEINAEIDESRSQFAVRALLVRSPASQPLHPGLSGGFVLAHFVQSIVCMATWNRNISMRALRAFCAAAEYESFREAAQQLYLTASAVSHQIKHLETELGTKLFARTSRSLSVTESGQGLYSDLKPILEER